MFEPRQEDASAATRRGPRRAQVLRALSLAALGILGLGVLVAFFLFTRSGLPQREGRAKVAGLRAEVSVRYDRWGTPFLRAGSARDVTSALGWVHANDRMFQMELGRRAVAGRLSEIFGRRALDFDKRSRQLRLRRLAEELAARASPETRELLDAYAEGVNAWLAARGSDLPPELRLLGVEPEPWTTADSFGFIFLMARNLSPIDEPEEIEAFRLLGSFGGDRTRELLGRRDAFLDEGVLASASAIAKARQPIPVDDREEGSGLGSNNWVIGPARSAGGAAWVANDPHLGLGVPGVWYAARLDSPNYSVSGVTLAGAPGVILGRGRDVAWGFTNLYVDDLDVFVEETDPSGLKVRRGDQWVKLDLETETIRVKDEPGVGVEVARSDRGIFLAADTERGLPARSLTWTGAQPGDQVRALLRLARARSVAEIPAAIESYVFPAQNLVAADSAGKILWTPIGRSPRRAGYDGLLPVSAARVELRWEGLVPAAENPVLPDAEAGGSEAIGVAGAAGAAGAGATPAPEAMDSIATANSFLPVPQPEWFDGVFDTPYRADRIRAVLGEQTGWTADDIGRLQTDVVSRWSLELVRGAADSFAAVSKEGLPSGDAQRALGVLSSWDGSMAVRGPSALLAFFERELLRRVFEDEAGKAGIQRFGTRWRLHRLLAGEVSADWWDDVTTPVVEQRRQIVEAALAEAWRATVRRFGSESPGDWNYGAMHQLVLDHPLGGLPVAGRLVNLGPYAVPGSATTVLAFGGPWKPERDGTRQAIDVEYGPSMRLIQNARDPDASRLAQPAGQSGHPFDAHYSDQVEMYLRGETRSLPWSDSEIEKVTVHRLTLSAN